MMQFSAVGDAPIVYGGGPERARPIFSFAMGILAFGGPARASSSACSSELTSL